MKEFKLITQKRFYNKNVPRFDIPTNTNLNLFWCSGSMLGVALGMQLVTGMVCSMEYLKFAKEKLCHFHSNVGEAGPLVDGLSMEILRFFHLWGATLIFICMAVHMGRGLYYCSYGKNPVLWTTGMVLYVVMMLEAFLGYLLPWHQMSYWAGVVMSTVFLSLPYMGMHLHSFLLGSYDFGENIMSRVFVAHVSFGFMILFLILLHFISLHKVGSSKSFNSSDSFSDSLSFHKTYSQKDSFVWMFVFLLTLLLTCYNPWLTSSKENFMDPNVLSTPTKMKPEWYFLPFYAMLRSMENKMGGLLAVVLVLFLLWLPVPGWKSGFNSTLRRLSFWSFFYSFIFLGIMGSSEPTEFCQFYSLLTSFILCISLMLLKCADYFTVFNIN